MEENLICKFDDYNCSVKTWMGLLESMTMPESYSDWDADPDLDVAGHLAKWHEVFAEMFIMVLMQLISNLIMLIPFFVLGKNTIFITLDYQIANRFAYLQ